MKKINQSEALWHSVLDQGTRVSDKKKSLIIQSTIQIVATQGNEAVTFEAIGKLLKTTKANVKYHFQDKDDLIFTAARLVVANAQAMTLALVDQARTPAEKLTAIVDAAYSWYQQFPDHVKMWAFFVYYSHINERYKKYYSEVRTVGSSRMQMVLRALPSESPSKVDYERLAELIQNIIYGQILALMSKPKEINENRNATLRLITLQLQDKGIKCLLKR